MPYEPIAITLYSSLDRVKPRCSVRLSYRRPNECGSDCDASTSSLWSRYTPASIEVRSPRPSTTKTAASGCGAASAVEAACVT